MDKLVEGFEQARLFVDRLLVATAATALAVGHLQAGLDLASRPDDGVAGEPGRIGDPCLTAVADHHRRRTGHDTSLTLVHMGQNRREEPLELLGGHLHASRLHCASYLVVDP